MVEPWRFWERQRLSRAGKGSGGVKSIDRQMQEQVESVRAAISSLNDPNEDKRILAIGNLAEGVRRGNIKVEEIGSMFDTIKKHYRQERSQEVRRKILELAAHVGELDFVKKNLAKEPAETVRYLLLEGLDKKHPQARSELITYILNNSSDPDLIRIALIAAGKRRREYRRVRRWIKPIPGIEGR